MIKSRSKSWIGRVAFAALAGFVCLQPLGAQSAAKVEQLIGQVSLMRDGHVDVPLYVGNAVAAQRTIVTGPNSYAKFLLEDNSTFEVYENSTVIFHADYGLSHLLNVIMGRVKVFIDHSKGPNNNSVTTPTAVISVRGTVFDVVVEDADGTTLVSCDEGLVQIQNVTAPGKEPLLHPGESYRVFRGQGIVGRQINKDPLVQKGLNAIRDAMQVALQRRVGLPGGVGGPIGSSTGGAQGDKGKGGAAPPPTPPPGGGH
jgi:ferric-dicitrate binding protein FerR (iron transport regulator)